MGLGFVYFFCFSVFWFLRFDNGLPLGLCLISTLDENRIRVGTVKIWDDGDGDGHGNYGNRSSNDELLIVTVPFSTELNGLCTHKENSAMFVRKISG